MKMEIMAFGKIMTEIYEPYINRLQEMAPKKHILISETGTSALTSCRSKRKQ